jgi:hypothetical protein
MALTAEQLLSITRNYWPSDLESSLKPEGSPEVARLHDLWGKELKKMRQWAEFVRALNEDLPEFTVGNITATFDACLRCGAYPRTNRPPSSSGWVVVGCVSILAPVYAIYGMQYEYSGEKRFGEEVFFEPLPARMRAPADIIARKLEATFGVSALPRELADTSVPLFVDSRKPPHTTLFHALFTSQPDSVP